MNTKTKSQTDLEVLHVIEQAKELREQAMSLDAQAAELARKLRQVRGTRDLRAKGTTWSQVGDNGPTGELLEVVQRMITEHPMTFQELLDRTGARANRIKGVIMRLQRNGVKVVNMGTETKALWFAPSASVWQRLQLTLKARRA